MKSPAPDAETLGGGRQHQALCPVAIVANVDDPVGEAIVTRLARAGLAVAMCGADGDRLSILERRIRAAGEKALAVGSGIDSRQSAARAAEHTMEAFGRIDALVHGASPPAAADWLALPEAEVERQVGRILSVCMMATAAVVPHMAGSGGGQIVNLVSSAARYRSSWFRPENGEESHALAAGAEGAVVAFTRQAAFELAPQKIRVNTVCMGLIRTPASEAAWRRLSERDRSTIIEEISLRRLGEPDEVAAAVEFLAAGAGGYVTGATIDVNGGWWVS